MQQIFVQKYLQSECKRAYFPEQKCVTKQNSPSQKVLANPKKAKNIKYLTSHRACEVERSGDGVFLDLAVG